MILSQICIEETWEITDGLDTLVATTHDNSPKLHDYDHWKDTETPDIDSFDAWLHNKFDLIEIASDQLDGVMSRLKDMIKGFADSALADFGTYTNPYLSAKKYADIANLPSNGASDPIKEDAAGKDVSKDEDDVTKDLDSSASVSGLFDNLSFEFHLEDVRDKLYTMEYVILRHLFSCLIVDIFQCLCLIGEHPHDIFHGIQLVPDILQMKLKAQIVK